MLAAQLEKQLESIHALHLTLEAERDCLKEKDFSQLNSILFKKQELLKEIEQLDKILSTDSSQNEINKNSNLQELKSEIENLLAACQKINNVNGQLVELSMKSNKHLMQLIKQETGKNSVTYDQKGLLNTASLLGKNIKA